VRAGDEIVGERPRHILRRNLRVLRGQQKLGKRVDRPHVALLELIEQPGRFEVLHLAQETLYRHPVEGSFLRELLVDVLKLGTGLRLPDQLAERGKVERLLLPVNPDSASAGATYGVLFGYMRRNDHPQPPTQPRGGIEVDDFCAGRP